MKKFLAVMLMALCASMFAGEVVIQDETLGKPISDKRTYRFIGRNTYAKVISDGSTLSCTEVKGKITVIMVAFANHPNYAEAMSFTLRMMAMYAKTYNGGVYIALSENFFITRYNGNNIVTARVEPDDSGNGNWIVFFTFEELGRNGLSYIKYIEE